MGDSNLAASKMELQPVESHLDFVTINTCFFLFLFHESTWKFYHVKENYFQRENLFFTVITDKPAAVAN